MMIKNRNMMQETEKQDLREKSAKRQKKKYCVKEQQNLKHQTRGGREWKREIKRSEKWRNRSYKSNINSQKRQNSFSRLCMQIYPWKMMSCYGNNALQEFCQRKAYQPPHYASGAGLQLPFQRNKGLRNCYQVNYCKH